MKDTNKGEQKKHRKKKKKHRLYAAIVLTLGIAIIALTILLLFNIQKIEIKGNEYCTDKEVQQVVQSDKLSKNSLYVVVKYAIGRGETLPCFESLKVGLKNPWTLKITVEEKPIVGCLSDDKEHVYFDKEGLVVRQGTTVIEGVPTVEGIDLSNVKLYKKLESGKTKILEEVLEASDEAKKYELSIDKIVCDEGKIYLHIGKICVNLGSNATAEKIAQISPIIEKLGNKAGTLHLENYSAGNGTITFEIAEETEENSQEK